MTYILLEMFRLKIETLYFIQRTREFTPDVSIKNAGEGI
jgi:hypothetical protein